MKRGFLRHTVLAAVILGSATVAATSLLGQSKPKVTTALPSLVGTWTGTATVQLGDSALVLPVSYTFTQTGDVIAGTAMVPGQGMGPISNVVRSGPRVQFRVTVTLNPPAGSKEPPSVNLLEHDGKLAADGAIEGMVNLKDKPVAKFRITPKK